MMKIKTALKCATRHRIALLKPAARITVTGKEADRASSTRGERCKVVSSLLRYSIIAPALIAASLSANADGYPECTTKIRWVATINNQVAMTPVQFILRDTATNAVVKQTTNHSGTYTLPCGKYTATATLGSITRGRDIIANTAAYDVIIEMGQ